MKIFNFIRKKLLYKVLVLLLLVSLVPVVFIRIKLVYDVKTSLKKEALKIQIGIAERIADNINSYIEEVKNILYVIHKSEDFVLMKVEKQKYILNNLLNTYSMFMEVTVIDTTGKERLNISRLEGNTTKNDFLQHFDKFYKKKQ